MAVSDEVTKFRARTHRLIASRYPTVGIFDDLVRPEDALAAMELEGFSNDRLTGALGRLNAIPRSDWAAGQPGASIAMAPFLHPSPAGGRFNSGTLGAWYAACDLETAIAETLFHHERRLRASQVEFPAEIQMRELLSTPDARLCDIRGLQTERPNLYDPDPAEYRRSQPFGEALRAAGVDGILYHSVRRPGGENVVIFKPRLLPPVLQGDHFGYSWDRQCRPTVFRLTRLSVP